MELFTGYHFFSSRFELDPDETKETNPYMFGRSLAEWLRAQLVQKGFEVEKVIAEDWGWCVMCQRKPYYLYAGCVSALNQDLLDRCEDPSSSGDVLWHVISVAEMPVLGRLFRKIDIEPGFEKLDRTVQEILLSEPSIQLADEEAIGNLVDDPGNLTYYDAPDTDEPEPVSRWISVPLGLLLLPIILLCAIGGLSLFFDNPPEYYFIRPLVGTVILLACLLLGSTVVRMILARPASHGGLFPPYVLRGFAVIFLLLPIGGLFTGFYLERPLTALGYAAFYVVSALGIWRLAKQRENKASRM